MREQTAPAQTHIVLLTLHKPSEFDFAEWLGGNVAPGSLSLIVDAESTDEATLAELVTRAEFGFVRSYFNYLNNGRVQVDLERLHVEKPVTCVIAFGEDDVVRAARLRERWGLTGQTVDNAQGFRDKSVTRERLTRAGISVHAGMPLTYPGDLTDFVGRHGLPVYVKPRTSSGSVFGRKISTAAQMEEFLEVGFAPRIPYAEYVSDLCVETFQPGQLYHIDGIAVGGGVAWMWPSEYLTSGLEIGAFAETAVVGSSMMSSDHPLFRPLLDYVDSVCRALALPHGHTFHAEVFVDAAGRPSLCEIACRTGGGRIAEAIACAGGPHLNQWQLLLQTGAIAAEDALGRLRDCVPDALCGWILIPPRRGRCEKVPDLARLAGVRAAKLAIRPGENGWERSFSGDSMGHLVIAGNDEAQLRARLQAAIRLIDNDLCFAD